MKITAKLLAQRQSKQLADLVIRKFFQLSAVLSGMALLVIIIFVILRGVQPFLPNYQYGQQSVVDFLFGLTYRQDQQLYGIGFIVINTLVSAFMALLLAFPLAVLSALYIVKVAPRPISLIMAQIVELLASIPSVVYGVFAAGVLTKIVSGLATQFGQQTAGGSSLLASILVLAIMIFPTITAISMSAIKAVAKDQEWGSLALGATVTQTQFKIVLRSAKSGIFAGAILGLGRAFGEATAVSMVAGNKMFGPTVNFFDITRTLTTTMLAGLKETTGLDYDIRFSIGIVLMVIILGSNFLLNTIKDRVGK